MSLRRSPRALRADGSLDPRLIGDLESFFACDVATRACRPVGHVTPWRTRASCEAACRRAAQLRPLRAAAAPTEEKQPLRAVVPAVESVLALVEIPPAVLPPPARRAAKRAAAASLAEPPARRKPPALPPPPPPPPTVPPSRPVSPTMSLVTAALADALPADLDPELQLEAELRALDAARRVPRGTPAAPAAAAAAATAAALAVVHGARPPTDVPPGFRPRRATLRDTSVLRAAGLAPLPGGWVLVNARGQIRVPDGRGDLCTCPTTKAYRQRRGVSCGALVDASLPPRGRLACGDYCRRSKAWREGGCA